jgi:hypothetical protein
MQIARVTNQTHCKLLLGSRVINKAVEFQCLSAVQPGRSEPLFEAETVFFNNCHKDFVSHWLTPSIFPKVQTILLNSQPREDVLCRFDAQIVLARRFEKYKQRWAHDKANVQIASEHSMLVWSSVHFIEPILIVPK